MLNILRRLSWRLQVFVPLAGLTLGGLATEAIAGKDSRHLQSLSQRAILPSERGTFPGLLRALGPAAQNRPARALIALAHRHQAELLRFIAQVSTPGNPKYGHYLTPAQFVARYAPAGATVAAVEAFARAHGLHVAGVPSNRAYVYVTGTVGEMEQAFDTRIGRFSIRGYAIQAPTAPVSVPARFARVITGVTGLNTGDISRPMLGTTPPVAAYVNAPPQSAYWGQRKATKDPGAYGRKVLPDVTRGYSPQQLEGAYGVAGVIKRGLNGRGQTVAVIDAYSSPTIVKDVRKWSSVHGLPRPQLKLEDNAAERDQPQAPAPISDLGFQDPQGWFGEETLDVEAVHTMAPGAKVVVQSAMSDLNIDLERAQNNVVAHKLAQIVSNSYGGSSDTTNSTSDGYWQQAAAQGMGVYFSAGDSGDQTSGGTNPSSRSVDSGPNSPYVTAVGGTTLAIGRKRNRLFETYWGTDSATLSHGKWTDNAWDYGGGGGTSTVYREPAWQKKAASSRFADYFKTHPCGICGGSKPTLPGRVVPDVAMLGDPNAGLLVGMTEDFSAYHNPGGVYLPGDKVHFGQYRLGGTSLSSPLFAGMMALADQAAGHHHGFANPALYRLYRTRAFHDIVEPKSKIGVVRTNYTNGTNASGGTSTDLRTAAVLGTLSSIRGYDDSTGLGSPNGVAFLKGLAPGSKVLRAALR